MIKKIIPSHSACMKLLVLFFLICCYPLLSKQIDPLEYSHEMLRQNKLDKALQFINQQIALPQSNIRTALFYVELGNAYKLMQQYEKSHESYQKALNIFTSEKNDENKFYVYIQLAELYRYRRMFRRAEDYLTLCENILENKIIKDNYLLKFYSRKAALFSEYHKNADSVFVYSKKALALSQKLGDSENELISLMEIANIYESKKNYPEAIRQLQKIVTLAQDHSNTQIRCDAMVNLARNLNFDHKLQESVRISLQGFDLAEQNKLSYNQLLFADNLQNIYNRTGDYQNAYKFLKIRLKLTEDYYHKLYDNKVLEYEEKFKIAEKEKIIDDNKKLLSIREEEIKRQNLVKYFILFSLLVILIFAAVLLRYIKIIKKQNKKLKSFSEQNVFLVSETHHRINNNLQLVRILIENELKKNPMRDDLVNKRILVNIDSLSILHRQLYNEQDKKNLNLKAFLLEIRQNLDFLFVENNIKSQFIIDEVIMPANNAMYIGLLLTELCMNTIKHAFKFESDKNIMLNIGNVNGFINFQYQDNGAVGLKIKKLNLIDKLCRQLKIDYLINSENGFKFSFKMKL